MLHICAVTIFVCCTFGLIVRKAAPGERRIHFNSVFGRFLEHGDISNFSSIVWAHCSMISNETRGTNAEQYCSLMYSRAQRGLWLNYSRRKYFDRNGSGASSTAAFIITSCSWLLIANDTHYFFWWPCCSSRVPNGITEVTFVTAISAAYTFRTRYLH